MKKIFLLNLLFYSIVISGQDKKICISVDDLPTVTYGASELDLSITDKLIKTFKNYNIPAIGYVNESKLYSKEKLDPKKVNLLEMWLQNGLDLGNHTYSHFDYNKIPDSTYFNDIINGEKVMKPLMKKYDKQLKYFRHPYLHTGADSLSHKRLKNFLFNNGYQVSPVTIDNDDYLFAKAYHNALVNDDVSLMKEIGNEYVDYMEQKILYFESKSMEIFNKNIAHTLLIHANLINANYFDKIAEVYVKYGYTFISQEEVLKTPEYHTTINSFSKYGYSWIFRWGISMGKGQNIRKGDIETPERIIQLAKN